MSKHFPAIPAAIQRVFDDVDWCQVYVDDIGIITADRTQARDAYNALSWRYRMLLHEASRGEGRAGSRVRVLREYMLWRAFHAQPAP